VGFIFHNLSGSIYNTVIHLPLRNVVIVLLGSQKLWPCGTSHNAIPV